MLELTKSLWNKGHHVYCDNFYTSPSLCLKLEEKGTGCCGTVRINRKGIPLSFQQKSSKKGEKITYEDGPITGVKWMDKRAVTALSTIHTGEMSTISRSRSVSGGVETIQKPTMIDQYNKFMGGVDKSDQLVTYYGFYHHSKKWWKRVFFHLVNVSLVNAYLIYCKVTTGRRLTHMDFRLEVAEGLIERSGAVRALPETPGDAMHLPVRLVGRDHYPEPSKTRDCRVCSRRDRKRKQTSFQCCTCKVPLCVHPCFRNFHTHKNYNYIIRGINIHAQTPFSLSSFT